MGGGRRRRPLGSATDRDTAPLLSIVSVLVPVPVPYSVYEQLVVNVANVNSFYILTSVKKLGSERGQTARPTR